MKPKEIILSVLLAVSAAGSFWAWPRVLGALFLLSAILVYAVGFGFFILLIKNKWLFWGAPSFSLAVSALFFKPDIFFFYGLGLGIGLILYASELYREEEASNLKILLRRLVGRSLRLFFTELALIFALVYYGDIRNNPDPAKLLLPESVFQTTLKLLEPALRDSIPGFNASDKKLAHTLYELSLARVKDYAGDYVEYISVLAALSYFFALKAVSVLFYYLAMLLIFLFLKLFIAIGLVKKELMLAEKEILV